MLLCSLRLLAADSSMAVAAAASLILLVSVILIALWDLTRPG